MFGTLFHLLAEILPQIFHSTDRAYYSEATRLERDRQVRQLFERGQELIKEGKEDEAEVQFSAARMLERLRNHGVRPEKPACDTADLAEVGSQSLFHSAGSCASDPNAEVPRLNDQEESGRSVLQLLLEFLTKRYLLKIVWVLGTTLILGMISVLLSDFRYLLFLVAVLIGIMLTVIISDRRYLRKRHRPTKT